PSDSLATTKRKVKPMRSSLVLAALTVVSLPACGSTDGTNAPSGGSNTTSTNIFAPGPAPQGYTRFVAQTIPGIEPGADVTFCQYVMPPVDHDIDVLDVVGGQFAFGHHAVAFSFTGTGKEQIGTVVPCMGTEFSAGDGTSATPVSMGTFL